MDTQHPKKEVKFGEIAVQKGFITEVQLLEVLTIQKQLAEMGIHEAVGEILQKKGFLKPDQVTQILKAMGIDVSPVPGYQIQAKLGQGGMGTVYKAKQVSMNRMVALKILSPEMTKNKEFVDRFLREARAAAQMNHKNIIQAYDAGVQNGIYYFAMEYINGHTVAELLKKKGRFTEKRALEVTGQIADALEYLHHHGMVHRDIKPENIMIAAEGGAVKLCDFGLVKEVRTDLSVTRSGFTFGTPYYMSPEQIQGKRLDSRADIYSLGTCFYKMLTGKNVFEGSDLQSVLTKHLTERVPSPKHLAPDVSDSTCKILEKMLEKDRGYRYRLPRELIHDIRSVLAGGEPVFARQNRRSAANLGLAVSVAVLVVAFGLGAYFLLGRDRVPAPAPPVVRPPDKPIEAPPPPRDVGVDSKARREADAEKIMVQANEYYEAQSWSRAADQFKKLMSDYPDTQYVIQHRDVIGQRWNRCKSILEDLANVQNGSAAEREKARRHDYDRAEADYIQGKWRDAQVRLEQLAAGALPDDLVGEVRDRLLECTQEIQAEDEYATLKHTYERGEYELVEPLVQKYRERFKSTVTLGKKTLELKLLVSRAATETQCQKAIAQARKQYESGDYEGYRAFFVQIKKDFGDSETFKGQEGSLVEWSTEALKKLKAPREKLASDQLKKADDAYRDGKVSEALEAYRKASSEYADTEAVDKRKAELDSRTALLERGLKEAREKEAANLFKSARSDYDKKKYREASGEIDELAKKYSDTAYVTREQKTIDALKEKIERELSLEGQTLTIDMTGGKVEGWKEEGPGDKDISESDEAGGRKCARLKLPPHEDGWTRLEYPVESGLSKDLKRITFRARSGERFTINTIFYLRVVEDNKKEYIYMAERQVAAGAWETYKIGPNEFKQVAMRPDQPPNPNKLDFTKVRGIGFCLGPKQSGYIMYVDLIRAETK